MGVNNGGGGGGSSGPSGPVVAYDTPEAHGAKRDGVTDDTAAITAAIASAVAAGQANGSNYAEVWFSAGIYQLTSLSRAANGPQFSNSQIPLPFIPAGTSTQKFTLKLRGLSSAGIALPHWNQTVGQKSGAVLRTTVVGTNDVTWGPASVIGGPTVVQGYGGGTGNAWSNMLVIVDGLTVVSATPNPTMCGFNFEGILEAKIVSAGYMADASPATMAGYISTPANFTNQWVFGLKMPTTNNNALSIVDDWSAEGVWYSIVLGEHCDVKSMRSVYCGWGISLDNVVGTPHSSHIAFAEVEICVNTLGLYGTVGTYKIDIDLLDCEGGSYIWDGNSAIQGTIVVCANATPQKAAVAATSFQLGAWIGGWNGSPTNGSGVRWINRDVMPGALQGAAPAMPASATPYYNPFMRDAIVYVSGGTVTSASVDGSLFPGFAGGVLIVPAGKPVQMVYSAAPSWKWVML